MSSTSTTSTTGSSTTTTGSSTSPVSGSAGAITQVGHGARRSRNDDPEAWWDFKGAAFTPHHWRPEGKTILEGLLEQVPKELARRPWRPGLELHIQGVGGFVGKERRHYTILGHGSYTNYIGGCRTLSVENQTLKTSKNLTVTIGGGDPKSMPDDIVPGRDVLTVKGDANLTFGGRTVMMSGVMRRDWRSGVMRLASMEGIICGGAFLRLIASPSVTLSALMTGDVYGGCARVSAVRTYLAVLQYRSARLVGKASLLYVRNASFVIEPVINVKTQETPKSNLARKLARLSKVVEVARMVCPVLDILVGLVTLVPIGLIALVGLIQKARGKADPTTMTGPPRLRSLVAAYHGENKTLAMMM